MKTYKTYIPSKKIKRLLIIEIVSGTVIILSYIINGRRASGLSDVIYIPEWVQLIFAVSTLFAFVFMIVFGIERDDEKRFNSVIFSYDFITIKDKKYQVDKIERITITYPGKVNKGKSSIHKNHIRFNFEGKEIFQKFALEKEELWKFFEFLRYRDRNKFQIVLT